MCRNAGCVALIDLVWEGHHGASGRSKEGRGWCRGVCAEVPEERAANIALAAVAAKARGALIDACAAYREKDSQARHPLPACTLSAGCAGAVKRGCSPWV